MPPSARVCYNLLRSKLKPRCNGRLTCHTAVNYNSLHTANFQWFELRNDNLCHQYLVERHDTTHAFRSLETSRWRIFSESNLDVKYSFGSPSSNLWFSFYKIRSQWDRLSSDRSLSPCSKSFIIVKIFLSLIRFIFHLGTCSKHVMRIFQFQNSGDLAACSP